MILGANFLIAPDTTKTTRILQTVRPVSGDKKKPPSRHCPKRCPTGASSR